MFDGHVDTLLSHYLEALPATALFNEDPALQFDLVRARRGGVVGAFLAVCAIDEASPDSEAVITTDGWEYAPDPPISQERALVVTSAVVGRLLSVERQHGGSVMLVRSPEALAHCLASGRFAVVLHLEGAEAIDPALEALDMWHAAGVRSIGPVWSRPNAFGHGVPFKYPSSPDTGPGLTPAGLRLVSRCNELGVMLDCAHLNEAGFWDLARRSDAPLAVTHTAAHAISPCSRCLTDEQLRALAASDGVAGVMFDRAITRAGAGPDAPETPITAIADHVRYIAELVGVRHVALGSDFDGASMPHELADASRLPELMHVLEQYGFSRADRKAIGAENWLRLLADTLNGDTTGPKAARPLRPA